MPKFIKNHPILTGFVVFIIITLFPTIDSYWDLVQKFQAANMQINWYQWVFPILPLVGLGFLAYLIWQVRKPNNSQQENTVTPKPNLENISDNGISVSTATQERDALTRQLRITPSAHPYIPDSFIQGRSIYLLDLIAPGARPVIQKRTIEDCEIRGPAMIGFLGTMNLDTITWDGDENSLFVEVEDNKPLLGVIGLEDCTIRRCRFVAVGIIGVKQQIDQMKPAFNAQKSASHKGPTTTTDSNQLPTFVDGRQVVTLKLGMMNMKGSVSDLVNNAHDFKIDTFKLLSFYITNHTLYVDTTLYGGDQLPQIQLKQNILVSMPPNWDSNSDGRAIEIVNNKQEPIFQLIYKTQYYVVINGYLYAPGGLCL